MPKFLDPTGKELTAGQALDVWLDYRSSLNPEIGEANMAAVIHHFADAVYGFPNDVKYGRQAGIEIKFGEES